MSLKKDKIWMLLFFFLSSLFIGLIGFVTDPILKSVALNNISEVVYFVVPGFFLCFILMLSLYDFIRLMHRRHLHKFSFASCGYLFGFISQQILLSSEYYRFLTNLTFEGTKEGNIFGIVVNMYNYFFAFLFGIIGFILYFFINRLHKKNNK